MNFDKCAYINGFLKLGHNYWLIFLVRLLVPTILYCVSMILHFYVVSCPLLTDPNNGVITCSLGDDGVPSYEDTCSFTCNNGYELTGSDTRTCQSDGSWSGSDNVCRRGE